jgi:hypothetical protein
MGIWTLHGDVMRLSFGGTSVHTRVEVGSFAQGLGNYGDGWMGLRERVREDRSERGSGMGWVGMGFLQDAFLHGRDRN